MGFIISKSTLVGMRLSKRNEETQQTGRGKEGEGLEMEFWGKWT